MKRFLVTAHIVFALVGIATTMLGPILPVLAQRWHLSDAQAGYFFIAQFLGGFVGSIVSTELVRRFSLHFTIRAGLLVTAAGVALVNSPLLPVALGAFALYGIGIGFCSPTITAAVGEAAGEQKASLLNLLNFVWTVGAISAPELLTLAMERGSIGMTKALAVLALLLVPAAFTMPRVQVTARQTEKPRALPRGAMAVIVTTGFLIFLYVGLENGVAGWLPTFSSRVHQFSARQSAALQVTFWTALLAGRFGATGILRYVREKSLLTVSIIAALAGTAGVLTATGAAGLYVSVAVVGLGFAPIFPTTIAVLTNSLAGQSGTKLGYMFAAAGLGGAVLPPCIGALSSLSGSLRVGMGLLIGAEMAMMTAHLTISRMARGVAMQEKKASAGI
jgi:FHS family glucose/mannose:H+ symporter-like MFS transporter